MELLYAVIGVFIILVLSEVLWRAGAVRGESARKFVHIAVGSYAAFWPYFMSWQQIQILSIAFFLVIFISWKGYTDRVFRVVRRHLKTKFLKSLAGDAQRFFSFRSVHNVQRRTFGEILFPVGIGLGALIQPSPIVFTAAILHLSLADGLAAIVGTHHGMRHQYKIRQSTKTLAGTATFYLVSTIIILVTVAVSGTTITWPIVPLLVWLPLAATVVENFSAGGTDNVFVPLLIIVVLQAARIT